VQTQIKLSLFSHKHIVRRESTRSHSCGPVEHFGGKGSERLLRTSCGILLIAASLAVSCRQDHKATNDPSTNVVKLRNELVSLAEGKRTEVSGELEPDERYILLYGYGGRLESLSVSPTLLAKLEEVGPPRDYEIHVLVHAYGDEIIEYTSWEVANETWHRAISPTPLQISGKHYRIRMGVDSKVILETEN
jgi:hypothetical protein